MTRRGFTLLETILASTLAMVVVFGCLGAFVAIDRADRVLASRFEQASDLARLQKTMQRTFSTIVVSPDSPLEEDVLLEEGEEPEVPVEEAEVEPLPAPRMALGTDPDGDLSRFVQISKYRAGGGGSSVASPQRLEVVLSSVPIRPPAVQSSAWSDALVGVDDLYEIEEGSEEELYSGVRGAFVLRPDDSTGAGARRRTIDGDERQGWTLWWQPLDGRSEPARIASGLAACQFRMFYDDQMLTEHVCYSASELPRFVDLEVETLNGLYANYLFEVVWTVDELVEEEENTDTAGDGQAGDAQGGGGGGDVTIRGNGGGARGEQGADGQRRGRPRPNAPQGAAPGQRQDGRPMRVPGGGGDRPGGGGGGRDGGGGGGRPTGPGGGGGGGGGG